MHEVIRSNLVSSCISLHPGAGSTVTLEQIVPTKISPERAQLCPRPWYQEQLGSTGCGELVKECRAQCPSLLCAGRASFSFLLLCVHHAEQEQRVPYRIFLQVTCCSLLRMKSLLIPWRERPQILLAQFPCTGAELKPLESSFPSTAS